MKRTYLKYFISPAIVAVVCAAVMAVVSWAYPRWTDAVARASASNYRQEVMDALQAGDYTTARNIAQYAVRMRSFDPEAHTMLAQVHRIAGDLEAARNRYEAALAIDSTPGPDYRKTRQPWYFAEARLDLGKMAIEAAADEKALWEAVRHFELARGYDNLKDPKYAAWHDVLYKTYGALGQWARALDFGSPSNAELTLFQRRSLEDLVAVCEARQDWELGARAATELLKRDTSSVPGNRVLFRETLRNRQLDAATGHVEALQSAADPDTNYFRGQLEEAYGRLPQAAIAFMDTDSRSLYQPFALAMAHRILSALPADMVPESAPSPDSIADQLTEILERSGEIFVQPTTAYTDALVVPAGFDPPGESWLRAGAFPVRVRWTWHNATPDVMPVAQVTRDGQDALTLFHEDTVLQLQWTENTVPFTGFHGLEPGATDLPGWVEPRYTFSGQVPAPSAEIAYFEENAALKVTSPARDYIAQLWTVPLPSIRDGNYLAAGRLRTDGTGAHLAWDSKDPLEVYTFNHYLEDDARSTRWKWSAAYQRRLFENQSVRLLLGIFEQEGTAWFDDLLLVPIREPQVSVPDRSTGATS